MKITYVKLISLVLSSLFIISFFSSVNATPQSTSSTSIIDINVDEAWNLVNDTSNGIQIPIDVRTDPEWALSHIDTPHPEHARHHCSCAWGNETILQEFIDTYTGQEIILYCKSGTRSLQAALTLSSNDFDGIIYNMAGGITAWEANGYPTISNRAPANPTLNGPTIGEKNQPIQFTFSTSDLDNDSVYYYIDWDDGEKTIYENKHDANEQILFTHTWTSPGIYTVKAKTRDQYFAESNWTKHQISISYTNLTISEVKSGIGSIIVDIENTGAFTATNISTLIQVEGGLFSNIQINHSCMGCSNCSSSLNPGEHKTESSREAGFIFGFGSININVTVNAANAKKINVEKTGIVIGPLIIIV